MGKVLLKDDGANFGIVAKYFRKRVYKRDIACKTTTKLRKTHHVVEIFYKVTTNNAMAICAP